MKRVIQTYKASHQWINSPPGLGDFVRGACHLFEKLHGSGIELRIDMSQTGFAGLMEQDQSIFQTGDEERIANAEEYFVDHVALHHRLVAFQQSSDEFLYICTNLGAWNRTTLPDTTRQFIQKIYNFNNEVEMLTAQALQQTEYEVLSVRCGDRFYTDCAGTVHNQMKQKIISIIEQNVMPRAQLPVAITSDCHELKVELAQRYGMLMLPHRSQHGAYGAALPVAMDLCMLKNSRFNYHINSWATWWSGFSHYTSILFNIPSMNFRAPHFAEETVTADGVLVSV